MAKILTLLGCCLFVILQTAANPISNGQGMFSDKFQGDVRLNPDQLSMASGSKINPLTGWTYPSFHWPTNLEGYVIVPYRILPSEGFTQSEIDWMVNEFRVIESTTCIRFVERTFQIDFVEIIDGGGCWAWAGRQGGRQEMSMDRAGGCLSQGIAIHEAIHVVGYLHMHSAIDRDNYVSIMWDNIAPDMRHNFDQVDPEWFSNFNTAYDLRSIMHYPRWAFSINGQDTVVPHDSSYLNVIGANVISPGDITRLNRMYQCRNYVD